MNNPKVGDVVRLRSDVLRTMDKPKDQPFFSTAPVKAILHDVKGGLFLERPLYGFRYWNSSEVEVMKM